jgi:hypothetical protein
MVKAITPVDDTHCSLAQLVLRTDTETNRPAADILAFDVAVENEDRDMLESLPATFPLAPHLNAHARADGDPGHLIRPACQLTRDRGSRLPSTNSVGQRSCSTCLSSGWLDSTTSQ